MKIKTVLTAGGVVVGGAMSQHVEASQPVEAQIAAQTAELAQNLQNPEHKEQKNVADTSVHVAPGDTLQLNDIPGAWGSETHYVDIDANATSHGIIGHIPDGATGITWLDPDGNSILTNTFPMDYPGMYHISYDYGGTTVWKDFRLVFNPVVDTVFQIAEWQSTVTINYPGWDIPNTWNGIATYREWNSGGDYEALWSPVDLWPGNYYARFSDDSWIDPLIEVHFTVKWASEVAETETPEIVAYPNPTTDIVKFKGLDSNAIQSVRIFDMQWRLLQEADGSRFEGVVDLSDYPSGIYDIMFYHNDGRHIEYRVVKQ